MKRRTAILTLIGVMAAIVALCAGLLVWIASGPVSDWVSHKAPGRAHSAAAGQPSNSAEAATPEPDATTKPAAWDAGITQRDPMKRAALRGTLSMVTWSPARMHSEAEGGLAHPDLFSSAALKQLKTDAKDGPLQNGDWLQRADQHETSVGSVKLMDQDDVLEHPSTPTPSTDVTVYATWKWTPSGEWSPWARIFQLKMAKRNGAWVIDQYHVELVARSDYEMPHY